MATNSSTLRSRYPPKAGLASICWRTTASCTSSAYSMSAAAVDESLAFQIHMSKDGSYT
jgi:hypothetical protein